MEMAGDVGSLESREAPHHGREMARNSSCSHGF